MLFNHSNDRLNLNMSQKKKKFKTMIKRGLKIIAKETKKIFFFLSSDFVLIFFLLYSKEKKLCNVFERVEWWGDLEKGYNWCTIRQNKFSMQKKKKNDDA